MAYRRRFAWSVLLRLYHWCFAFSTATLVVSGLYVHYPWTNTLIEGSRTFPMATMRYVHFLAGFVFLASLAARAYLLVFGNRQERFWDFLPVTPRNIRNLGVTILAYLYLREPEERVGHNSLAGLVYLATFLLGGLQVLSGLYLLYPENQLLAGWGTTLFGSQQQARFLHYLIMWYFCGFAALHVYLVVWNDVRSKEGIVSSMIHGRKYFPERRGRRNF